MISKEKVINLLKTDTKKWNEYRRTHPDEKIDISGANLEDEDLRAVILTNANLSNVNFSESNLMAANLRGSNCQNADFTFANLSYSKINNADFYKCPILLYEINCCRL